MEAMDTVNQFIKINLHSLFNDEIERIKQEQAAISFRAGKQEVVDWIKANDAEPDYILDRWKEKLEEWGVKG